MINGAHVLLYSRDPDADRAFFRDVLDLRSVDAGGGWLIFALPPSEVALHPEEGTEARLHSGSELLGARRVSCTRVSTEPWGHRTTIPLPSGGEVGLYQPTHATARDLPRPVG